MSYRWLFLAFVIALLGGTWVWANRVPAALVAEQQRPASALNHPAPAFDAAALGGGRIASAALAGKPIVLNFWATWCGPCRSEMPALQNAAQRYGERVAFVGVDQGEDEQAIRDFADQLGITFPLAVDKEQAVGAGLYNVKGLPTTYFIDSEGIVRRVWMGEMNSITLEEGIAEILD